MGTSNAFIIPAGLSFEQGPQGISIEHEGDIILQGELGGIHRLTSLNGDIRIEIPLQAQEIIALKGTVSTNQPLQVEKIQAQIIHCSDDVQVQQSLIAGQLLQIDGTVTGGKLQSHGDMILGKNVQVQHIASEGTLNVIGNLRSNHLYCAQELNIKGSTHAQSIEFHGPQASFSNLETNELIAAQADLAILESSEITILRANNIQLEGVHKIKAIQAFNALYIDSGSIHSDIVLCNSINLSPNVEGKIIILESKQPPGVHKIKGCLELEDIKMLMPAAIDFMEQYGMQTAIPTAIKNPKNIASESIANVVLPQSMENVVPFEDSDFEDADFDGQEDDLPTQEEIETTGPAMIDVSNSLSPTIEPISYKDFPNFQEVHSFDHISDPQKDATSENFAKESVDHKEDLSVSAKETMDEIDVYHQTFDGLDEVAIQNLLDQNLEDTHTLSIQNEPQDQFQEPLSSQILSPQILDDEMNINETNFHPVNDSLDDSLHDTWDSSWSQPNNWNARNQGSRTSTNNQQDDDYLADESPIDPIDEETVPQGNPLHADIRQEIQNLANVYGDPKPKPVMDLLAFLEDEDYLLLRNESKHIWAKLLTHHQREDSRLPLLVTTAFNQLKQKLDQL